MRVITGTARGRRLITPAGLASSSPLSQMASPVRASPKSTAMIFIAFSLPACLYLMRNIPFIIQDTDGFFKPRHTLKRSICRPAPAHAGPR